MPKPLLPALLNIFTRRPSTNVRSDSDAQRFAAIYEAEFNRIFAYLSYRVNNSMQAEDLTAEVFVRLWTHLAHLRTPEAVVAWLFTTARNIVTDYYRKVKDDVSFEQVGNYRDLASTTFDKQLVTVEQQEVLTQALNYLNRREREIVELRFIAGLSNSEIAHVVGTSVGNVAKIIHRALAKLRLHIRDRQQEDLR
jgi:RNA polymerase sigma factor (sigma-70 family)